MKGRTRNLAIPIVSTKIKIARISHMMLAVILTFIYLNTYVSVLFQKNILMFS